MNRKAKVAIVSAIVSIASFATTATAGPLSVAPDSMWAQTNDEAGWALVSPTFGAPFRSTAPADGKPLRIGDMSVDGQYVYAGEDSGWQVRQAQYRLDGGRFVRVDDLVGRANRHAGASVPMGAPRAETEQLAGG